MVIILFTKIVLSDRVEVLVCMYRTILITEFAQTSQYADKDEVMESMFIEIVLPHERNVNVGLIYRPPNQNVNDFVTRMNDVLGKIPRDKKTCYLMGYFNLNLLNNENHNATGKLFDGLYSHSFNHVTFPNYILHC